MIKLDLSRRSTTEVVVLFFTMLISTVLTVTVVGAVIAKCIHPDIDLNRASEAVNQMASTIVGALVGFISGRAYGRREAEQDNGHGKSPDTKTGQA